MSRRFVSLGFFLVFLSGVFAQTTEAPVWHVGDEWGWGRVYEVPKIQVENLPPDTQVKTKGKVEMYAVSRVVTAEENYVVDFMGGMEMKGVTISVVSDRVETLGISLSGFLKMSGEAVYTRSLEIVEVSANVFGSLQMAVRAMVMEVEMKMEKPQVQLLVKLNPPLNLLDFPLEVGKSWNIESAVEGTVKISIPLEGTARTFGFENEFSESIQEEIPLTGKLIAEAKCSKTVEMEIDGIKDNCFEIELHIKPGEEELRVLPVEEHAIPLRIYYSPLKKNIVGVSFVPSDLFGTILVPAEVEPVNEALAQVKEFAKALGGEFRLESVSPTVAIRKIEAMGKTSGVPFVVILILVLVLCVIVLML